MTIKHQITKAIYPLIMWLSGLKSNASKIKVNAENKKPFTSLFNTSAVLNNNESLSMSSLKGKKILLVNTASDCGFTGQYAELEKLHQQYKGKLVILGFPANDFKNQETGTDADINSFCTLNYGVTFPIMKKTSVIKNAAQNEIFKWLSDATKNGWNNEQPIWNFSKYLVNEEGVLTHYFEPSVSPMNKEVLTGIG